MQSKIFAIFVTFMVTASGRRLDHSVSPSISPTEQSLHSTVVTIPTRSKPSASEDQNAQGQYQFKFIVPGHTRIEQAQPDGSTKGSYSYIDSLGKVQNVQYSSGTDDYKTVEEHSRQGTFSKTPIIVPPLPVSQVASRPTTHNSKHHVPPAPAPAIPHATSRLDSAFDNNPAPPRFNAYHSRAPAPPASATPHVTSRLDSAFDNNPAPPRFNAYHPRAPAPPAPATPHVTSRLDSAFASNPAPPRFNAYHSRAPAPPVEWGYHIETGPHYWSTPSYYYHQYNPYMFNSGYNFVQHHPAHGFQNYMHPWGGYYKQ